MYVVSENIFIAAYQSFFASISLLCVNLPSVQALSNTTDPEFANGEEELR